MLGSIHIFVELAILDIVCVCLLDYVIQDYERFGLLFNKPMFPLFLQILDKGSAPR